MTVMQNISTTKGYHLLYSLHSENDVAPGCPSRYYYVLQKTPYTFISSPLRSLNLKSKSQTSLAGSSPPRSAQASPDRTSPFYATVHGCHLLD
jgi:hypothetical protein